MPEALRFDEVAVKVGGRRSLATLLPSLSLEVPYGKIHALSGPSGAGKTTALRVAACAIAPTEGRAAILGWDTRLIRGGRVAAVRRMVGIVPQGSPYGRERRTVESAFRLVARRTGRSGRGWEGRMEEVLALTETDHLAGRDIQNLSVGETRRVSIARALLTMPHILLLDEPTANLDRKSADAVLRLMSNAKEAGLAVIAATHDERVLDVCDGHSELVRS